MLEKNSMSVLYGFLFIYALVAIRVFLFFCEVIWHSFSIKVQVLNKDNQPIASYRNWKLLKVLTVRSISATLLWPIDFYVRPKTFLKALLFRNRMALINLVFYYGQTS